MEIVNQIFGFIGKLLEWWFVVMPWEQAIFVRKGSKVKLLKAGIYFKIPFIDMVFIQTIRTRTIDLPVQTASTIDGKTITMKSFISYSIGDMYKLYNTLAMPELSLSGMVMGGIAEYIRSNESKNVAPKNIETFVNEQINAELYGLKEISIKITSWAEVKTFRLIQDASWQAETLNMEHTGFKKN